MNETDTAVDVEAKAKAILANSPIPALRRVCVTQANNALILSGSVGNFYTKQLAQEAVRAAACDREVVNRIRVAGPTG